MSRKLSEVIYWPMSAAVHEVAMESMNNRALLEVEAVQQGGRIEDIHGQAVKNYPWDSSLINGAANFLEKIGQPVKGVGADLGSGTGSGACVVSKYPAVTQVYAVECSEMFVKDVMPIVFEHLNAQTEKIQRVVGDFDRMQVEDGSLDFLVEIGSYHHSDDLARSARESWRVLKPGGVIIALDRAWQDDTSRQYLEELLDKPLNVPLKRKYGLPEDQPFTRRDWGEHEYTFGDWEKAFGDVGFSSIAFYQTHPTFPGANFILTKLPALSMSYQLAARRYRKLKSQRLPIYGWAAQQAVFVFIKP